jgi:outer membrane protein assembly factor BamA
MYHYKSRMIGVRMRIIVFLLLVFVFSGEAAESNDSGKSLNVFPIVMYDTDIGFGYGAKGKIVSFLSLKESFDLLLFSSTKGERLLDFIFSFPDKEIRQGHVYSFSLDFTAKYNRILKDNYYGIGPDSREEDLVHFTNEKKELKVTLGHGFTSSLVGEVSYCLRNIRYFDVEDNKAYTEKLRSVGEKLSPFFSLIVRYDTSDSQIHPTRGFRLQCKNDLAYAFLGNKNASFARLILDLRQYFLLFGKKDVLAVRLRFQSISGNHIPLFELSVLGGGSTENALRGYKMNRFQDKGKILLNVEYRFPLWAKLGGNIFVDYGVVGPSLGRLNFRKSAVDIGCGLRYYLENFLARFDLGFSKEGMGIYFQFNHIF